MNLIFKLAAVSGIIYAAVLADRRSQQSGENRVPFYGQDDDESGVSDAEILQADDDIAAQPTV